MTNAASDNFRIARFKAKHRRAVLNKQLIDTIPAQKWLAERAIDHKLSCTPDLLDAQIELCNSLGAAGYPEYAYRSAKAFSSVHQDKRNIWPPEANEKMQSAIKELTYIAAFYGHARAYSDLAQTARHNGKPYLPFTLCAAALGDASSNLHLGERNFKRFNDLRAGKTDGIKDVGKHIESAYLLTLWHFARTARSPDYDSYISPVSTMKKLLKDEQNTKALHARYPKIFGEVKQALKMGR